MQPKERLAGMPRSTRRCMLVNDFVNNFNKYRELHYVPYDLRCVDKSMFKWYSLGRHWINMILPMEVVIELNLVNDCRIQNSCDARS